MVRLLFILGVDDKVKGREAINYLIKGALLESGVGGCGAIKSH